MKDKFSDDTSHIDSLPEDNKNLKKAKSNFWMSLRSQLSAVDQVDRKDGD